MATTTPTRGRDTEARADATATATKPGPAAPLPRRRPTAAGCLQALALMAQYPTTRVPLPRLHVAPVRHAGTLFVLDRASGERFAIYTPKYEAQFREGHRAGLWYARPVDSTGSRPISRGFSTAREAAEALKQGRWRRAEPTSTPATRNHLRIHWTPLHTPA